MNTGTSIDATTAVEHEPLAYRSLLREETTKIKIGPECVAYFVHPGLLSQHSEYFKRATSGSWKEAEERVITLDDVQCGTFELFLEWLYSQQYPKDHRFGAKGRSRKKQLARLKACAFGDRFMAPAFRAASESAFIDSMIVANRSPYYDSIVYAYEHLPSDSSVFQTLVDAHCYGFVEASDI